MIKKILQCIDFLLKAILVITVASFIVIVFAQVIARYVFNHSLSWSEELARILFTQMIFLAAPLAVLDQKHITVDIVLQYIPANVKRYLMLVIYALSIVFFCFLAVSGYQFAIANTHQTTAALHIPMGILYAVIPVSAVLMIVNCLRVAAHEFFPADSSEKEVHR